MTQTAHAKIRDGLVEALRSLHTELAWFQFNSAVISGSEWCPHVSDAEALEDDFDCAGLPFQAEPYDVETVKAAIPKIVEARVGRLLASLEVQGHG